MGCVSPDLKQAIEHQVQNAEQCAQVCECFTLQAIADRYGCHLNTVWSFNRRRRHRASVLDNAAEIAEDLAHRDRLFRIRSARYTTTAIARIFGVSRATVEAIKYNLKGENECAI